MKNLFIILLITGTSLLEANMNFLSFFNINKAEAAEDKWEVKHGTEGDKSYFVRKNTSAGSKKNRTSYSQRVGFAIPFKSKKQNGDATPEELAEINKIEDKLASVMEKEKNAIQVLAVRGSGFQEFVFYVSPALSKKLNLKDLASSFKSHEVQYYIEADPKWTTYDTF